MLLKHCYFTRQWINKLLMIAKVNGLHPLSIHLIYQTQSCWLTDCWWFTPMKLCLSTMRKMLFLPNQVLACPANKFGVIGRYHQIKRPASSSSTLTGSLSDLTSHWVNSRPICLMTRPHHPLCSRCQSPNLYVLGDLLQFSDSCQQNADSLENQRLHFSLPNNRPGCSFSAPIFQYTRS